MTPFWIRLEQGVEFAIRCAELMRGGEIFVPKIPSMRIMDLVTTVAPGCTIEDIGIRPGEKLHEILISEDESRQALEYDEMFVIEPLYPPWPSAPGEGASHLPRASDTPAAANAACPWPPGWGSWSVNGPTALAFLHRGGGGAG